MTSNYERNKQHIYRYKQAHPERWREINKRASKRRHSWHRIQAIFLHILLEAEAPPTSM